MCITLSACDCLTGSGSGGVTRRVQHIPNPLTLTNVIYVAQL